MRYPSACFVGTAVTVKRRDMVLIERGFEPVAYGSTDIKLIILCPAS